MKNLKTSFLAVFSALAVSIPAGAFALTPQQALNLALPATLNLMPSAMHADLKLDISERDLVKRVQSGTGDVHVTLKQRNASTMQNEGQIVLDRLVISPATGQPTIEPMDPISFQWKTVDMKTYFRIERFPAAVSEMLKAEGVDLTPYIGQWIVIDLQEILKEAGMDANFFAKQQATVPSPISQFLTANKPPILLVTRIEKRMTDANGDKIIRARVRVNSYALSALRLKEIAAVAKDDPFRADEIAQINKRYADLRSFLAKTQFVAEINETAGFVRRLEMGGKYVSYDKTCTWNTRYKRSICKNTSSTTVKYAAGMTFMKDSGAPVLAEPNAMPLQELMEKLMPTPVEPTTTEPGI